MNIYEFQAKELLKENGIKIMQGFVSEDLSDIRKQANDLECSKWVIKAQIQAGSRGLGGGIKIANSLDEVENYASEILGKKLITPQTSKDGEIVDKIYIEKFCEFIKEYYLSFMFNRSEEVISLIASTKAGVDIENNLTNDFLKVINIDPMIGLREFHIYEIANFLGIEKTLFKKFSKFIEKIYEIYIKKDATMIEINPLVLNLEFDFIPLDAKMSFDDYALFRQPEILALKDLSKEKESEIKAKEYGLSYVSLDGDIGCIVNGAGLAMATMDVIEYFGGKCANFLDVGGKTTPKSVKKAIEIILENKKVKAIFVNIFGGIVRCDLIASGILEALSELKSDIPIIIRLNGTNKDVALNLLNKSKFTNLFSIENLEEGVKKAINFAKN